MSARSLLAALLAGAAPARAQTPALTVDLEFMPQDPIVIEAPRTQIKQPAALDPRINSTLLRLLQQRAEARPGSEAALDQSVVNLGRLTTVTGHKLKTRYTELGFLLTEGLAGVDAFQLQSALETVARTSTNPQTRAAALVALAYTRDPRFEAVLQEGLQDQNVTVRLGAVEGLSLLGGASAGALLQNTMLVDRSLTVRALAAAAVWRGGEPRGKEILRELARHEDWYVRALGARYLGELGGSWEYDELMRLLDREENGFVQAELTGALLKLRKRR